MLVQAQLFSGQIKPLIKELDEQSRQFDYSKYGLIPKEGMYDTVIYAWLKSLQVSDMICPYCSKKTDVVRVSSNCTQRTCICGFRSPIKDI